MNAGCKDCRNCIKCGTCNDMYVLYNEDGEAIEYADSYCLSFVDKATAEGEKSVLNKLYIESWHGEEHDLMRYFQIESGMFIKEMYIGDFVDEHLWYRLNCIPESRVYIEWHNAEEKVKQGWRVNIDPH